MATFTCTLISYYHSEHVNILNLIRVIFSLDINNRFPIKTTLSVYTTHSEYASQLGFLPQFATLACSRSAQGRVNSLQSRSRDACSREKPTFLVRRRKTPTFRCYERPNVRPYIGACKQEFNIVFFGIRSKTRLFGACKRTHFQTRCLCTQCG